MTLSLSGYNKVILSVGNGAKEAAESAVSAASSAANASASAVAAERSATSAEAIVAGAVKCSSYGIYSGTENAIVVTAGLSGISVGTEVRFRATATNTGASTLDVDGSGVIPCQTITGVALPPGYIRTSVDTVARYDGTYWVVHREPERGSNANGEYVRFADGTQICYTPDVVGVVAGEMSGSFYRGEQSVIFPATFSGKPSVTTSSDSSFGWGNVCAVTMTGFVLVHWSTVSSTVSATGNYVAVGRWY